MSDDQVYSDSSNVKAKDGVVTVRGPDAVNVKLTPEAAEETADRLMEGAATAQGQRYMKEHAKRDAQSLLVNSGGKPARQLT